MSPRLCFAFRQIDTCKSLSQLSPGANFWFVVGNQPSDGNAVLDQNKRDVLVTGTVDALSEVARRFHYADGQFLHNIRLPDFQAASTGAV